MENQAINICAVIDLIIAKNEGYLKDAKRAGCKLEVNFFIAKLEGLREARNVATAEFFTKLINN